MLKTRWYKIFRDFSLNKARTAFVFLAICIGVFGLSVVVNSYSILQREMDKNYMNTNPASASLWTTPIDESYISQLIDLPYIKDAEQREKVVGRVQVGNNEWKDIWLFVVNDFNNLRLDIFAPEKGKDMPGKGEILFERKALSIAKAHLNQNLNIRIPDGRTTSLKLVGTVHAPGLAPAWMEGYAYGYITKETLELLGGKPLNTELKILVSEDSMNKQHIKDNVKMLKDFLEKDGVKVTRIEIPNPGKHPHYDQMATLLFLMEVFGLFALILSGILVANMISGILEQQTRQIGIMKAIGAGSKQIVYLYEGMVLLLSVAAMLVSIPAGIAAGRGYAELAAEILNFNIYSSYIPFYVFLLEIAVGLLIPMITALYPIIKGSRITVRKAVNDYGINQEKYVGKDESKSYINRLTLLSRPFLMSLRNTFRRKGRLVFTMLVMAVGGTGFITAMNIYASMYNTIDAKIDSFTYDIQFAFDKPQQEETIERVISRIPGIMKAEAWGGASAARIYPDRTFGNDFRIIAPPSSSKLMSAQPLYEGRWLEHNDSNAIVVNQKLISAEPDLKIGDEILLRIYNTESKWKIIGISKELIGPPTAYVNSEYLSKQLKFEGLAGSAAVVTNKSTSVSRVAESIEKELSDADLYVSSLIKINDYRKAIEDHLLLIVTFLIVMSVLVVLVGGLGLATTVSINTLERTREIGIMRAIGSSTYKITGIIVAEGVIIGILSWFVSILLAWPLSKFVNYNFGMIFFESPLEFAISISGYAIWLLIVIVFAALASFSPSWKASRMSVRSALAYE